MDPQKSPMIRYLRKVLDEHTLPLADEGAGIIDAGWLVDMLFKLEEYYRTHAA